MRIQPKHRDVPPEAIAPQPRRGRPPPRREPRARARRPLAASAAYPSGFGADAVREELAVAAGPPAWSPGAAGLRAPVRSGHRSWLRPHLRAAPAMVPDAKYDRSWRTGRYGRTVRAGPRRRPDSGSGRPGS